MIECCPNCRSIDIEDVGGEEYECQECFCLFNEKGEITKEAEE